MIPGIVAAQSVFALPAVALPPLTPLRVNETDEIFLIFRPTVTFLHRSLAPGLVTAADSFPVVTSTGGLALASFNGSFNSNVLVSNGNLTVTHNNSLTDAGAWSAAQKTTGKYYFEVTMTTTHGAFDCVGILNGGNFSNLVTNGTNCLTVYKGTGNIFSNNANTSKTLGAIASGDIIGVAVDLTARKGWVRKNGGLWNGLAIGSENPVTGLGGVVVAATIAFAPAVGFGGSGTIINDQMTGNFAAALPSGFSNWTA